MSTAAKDLFGGNLLHRATKWRKASITQRRSDNKISSGGRSIREEIGKGEVSEPAGCSPKS